MTRKIAGVSKSVPTLEGAGVHLKRAFGFQEAPDFDPFLLLDDFHSDRPEHYLRGFPWHPHRGIETITYVLHGDVEHGDSMGNGGVIREGDVQWMTAGSGIIHQEMPHGDRSGLLWGFQLWANLPASHKMMEPRYREVKQAQIPGVTERGGVKVKVICGSYGGVTGPVREIETEPEYLDVTLEAGMTFTHEIRRGHRAFAYVILGSGHFFSDDSHMSAVGREHIVSFDDGDSVSITASEGEGLRFLLISGRPLNEPVAWRGPIVMNTQAELKTAFDEYANGTFLKHKNPVIK